MKIASRWLLKPKASCFDCETYAGPTGAEVSSSAGIYFYKVPGSTD